MNTYTSLEPSPSAPERPRSGRAIVAALAVVVLAALTSGSAVHSQAPVAVDIRDSKFLPPSITVPVGTTVRWTNRDEETHTVTSSTGAFGSAGLDLNEDYGYTFTKAGVYPYTCDLHPFMNGTVTVTGN